MVANNGVLITQYDKDALEDLNFLKMDILGLGTLDIISEAMEMIGKDVLLEHELDLQDSKVMSEFCKGNTTGVFTFETYGMKKTLKSVQPESIKDLSAVNALYRPGAMSGIEHFLNGKESKTIYYFEDEKLKPILAETYGTIVYQEQVMAMFQAVAGFSASKADLVRKAVGKKKHEEITKMKKEFVDGCLETGHTQEWAVNLFNVIEKSTTYSFNRSHAMSYALLGYQCMFLKCYYPVQFMTRLLANHMDNGWDATLGEFDKKSKLKEYEKEAKRLGIKIVDFNVNTSRAEYRCNVDKKVIYRGLSAIKNVGAAAEEIEKLKPFTSFEDFYKRVSKSKVRSNAMVALIDCGAFDSIESNRDRIRGYVGAPIKGKERVKEKEISLFEE
jgi:DNA polymerase-3 subunit alpha